MKMLKLACFRQGSNPRLWWENYILLHTPHHFIGVTTPLVFIIPTFLSASTQIQRKETELQIQNGLAMTAVCVFVSAGITCIST